MKKIKKIIIGTHNQGKFKEISNLLPSYIKRISPKELNLPSPKETGSSFTENSKLKAQFFSEKSKLSCISDDSGLEIDLLSGAPGIHSSRWAGSNNDFNLAMDKVFTSGFKLFFILWIVFISCVKPSKAKNSVCRGTTRASDATNAIIVSRLRDGGQSISI